MEAGNGFRRVPEGAIQPAGGVAPGWVDTPM